MLLPMKSYPLTGILGEAEDTKGAPSNVQLPRCRLLPFVRMGIGHKQQEINDIKEGRTGHLSKSISHTCRCYLTYQCDRKHK